MKPFCEQLDPFTVTSDYNSHRPMLRLALLNVPNGTVIELGMGEGSTALLTEAAKEQDRRFISYENNAEWYAKMIRLHTPYNNLKFITDWDAIRLEPCAILFVDHAPGERRRVDIELFRSLAEVIVVHDTEESAEYVYGMQKTLSLFRYRLEHQEKSYPRTTVVSDKIDVSKWIL